MHLKKIFKSLPVLFLFIYPSLSNAQGSVSAELTRAVESISSSAAKSPQFSSEPKYRSPSSSRITQLCNDPRGIGQENGWFSNGYSFDACNAWAQAARSEETAIETFHAGPKTTEVCRRYGGDVRAPICEERDTVTTTDQTLQAAVTTAQGNTDAKKTALLGRAIAASSATAGLEAAQRAFTAAGCNEDDVTQSAACAPLLESLNAAKTASQRADNVAEGGSGNSEPEEACAASLWSLNLGKCLYDGAVWLTKVVIIGAIAGPILNIAGLVFDASLSFSVIGFPKLLGSLGVDGSQSESSIYSTWIIVRNLFNIIIVFQLLKIAIYKILSPVLNKSGGELKKLLASIIIFTLFVNFSFFFTKALIDISNITTLQFYAGLGAGTDREDPGIDVAITEALGVSTAQIFGLSEVNEEVYRGVTAEEGATISDDSFSGSFLGVILLFCLLILASFVLLQGAAIFLTRSVVLIFLLVFSPLMFAGGIIGFVNKWSEKWWNMLMEQLFVAPLYLGMLFITLKIAGDGQTYGLLTIINNPSITTIASDPDVYFGSIVSMIIQAIIMAGLFISAVSLAKEFGGAAAKKSSAWGAKAYGAAVGGAGGLAGRRLGGALGSRLQNSSRVKKWAESTGATKTFGMGLLNVADRAKTSSFDVRGSSALKSLNAATGGRLGLKDLGEGKGAGGFAADRAAADKKREDKLKREQDLLKTDTYGMSPEEKKKADKADKERQERARAGQAVTSATTDAEFEKLKRNEEGLEGDELKYAQEYNKSLDEARKKAKSALGQIQSAGSSARSRITGRATGSDIAARGTALGRTDDENKKLKDAEIKKKKDAAAKKRSDAVKKIFEEFSEDDSGEWRTEEQIKEKVSIQIEIEESKMARYQQAVGPDGIGGTEEERQELKKLIARTQALKDSRTRTKSWIKNRENSAWRETPATHNPPTPPTS